MRGILMFPEQRKRRESRMSRTEGVPAMRDRDSRIELMSDDEKMIGGNRRDQKKNRKR